MKLFLFALFFIITLTLSSTYSMQQNLIATETRDDICLPWDSQEGLKRFQDSEAKENFWKLSRYYESQIRLTYCSVGSAVIALNAMAIEAPPSEFLGKYRIFSQENFFTDSVSAIIDKKEVEARGMSLNDLSAVLDIFPVNIEKFEAVNFSYEKIKSVLISALQNPNQIVLALYQRKNLNQEGGGHWSPIAAYDKYSDSFLVMDVARYKYPPLWIDSLSFIDAMQTLNIYDKSRGFIILTQVPL